MGQKLFKLNISSKVTLLIIFTGIFIVFFGLLSGAFLGGNLIRETTGRGHLEKTEIMSTLISSLIDEKVRQLELPATRRLWIIEATNSNRHLAQLSPAQRRQYFERMDKDWLANEGNNSLVKSILARPISFDIKAFTQLDPSIAEMFIADQYGGVVGASNKITDYYQADEAWWQKSFADGRGEVYISKIEFDQSSDLWGMMIAVPIRDKNNNVIGVIKTVLNSKFLFYPLTQYHFGKTGEVLLFDINSDTVYDFGEKGQDSRVYDKINIEMLKKLLSNNKHFDVIRQMGNEKEKFVIAYSQILNPFLQKYNIKLLVLVVQNAEEMFGPLRRLAQVFFAIGIISMLLLIPLGWFLSRQIAGPINAFSKMTKEVIRGNWDYKFPVKTGDEIEDFANSFQMMIDSLKDQKVKLESFANGLEAKVRERTKELSETEEATLNILEDLTEAKQKLEQYSLDLETALKVKTDFTSMVSHEMRTPLTAIKEGIAIVTDGSVGPITAEQQEFLNIAKNNVDRLHRLINDVLDFSKLEAKKLEFHFASNDLRKMMLEVISSQKAVAESKGLSLKLEGVDDLPIVIFDVDRITQVMINLLSNAIKFTDKGEILVKVGRDESGKNVKICVVDSGIGIMTEDFSKLFQKFGQLGGTGWRKTGGTGLGLAICKEIIDQHKGRIWVESEVGKGSKFCFILPILSEGLS